MALHSMITDEGTYFDIRPPQHRIVIPEDYTIAGAMGDHDSEIITFRCPKTIDGHEVKDCGMHWLNWAVGTRTGKVDIRPESITSDEQYIYFPWIVTGDVTKTTGTVTFSVHFEDLGDDGEILYRWSTSKNTDLRIVDTQYNPDDEYNDIMYVELDAAELLAAVDAAVRGALY